jgi:hypothetical protein
MIVTAFPRSAGTFHCMQLAKQRGLLFADEPFQRTIITGYAGKFKIHEAYTPETPYADYDPDYVRGNLDKFVVLSHRSVPEVLEQTELFIVRQDINQIAESWVDLFIRDGGHPDKAMEMFLDVGLRNIRRVCEHLLTVDSANVLKCETLYRFNYRTPTLPFKLLVQQLVDEVYRKYP